MEGLLNAENALIAITAIILNEGWKVRDHAKALEEGQAMAKKAIVLSYFSKLSTILTLILSIPTSLFFLKGGPQLMQGLQVTAPDGAPFYWVYSVLAGLSGPKMFNKVVSRYTQD